MHYSSYGSNACCSEAMLQNKAACERGIFLTGLSLVANIWCVLIRLCWGGDYQRLREINVLLITRTWVGGRPTVLFMTGPVSALSPASQIPETGKYFNCKHPWLDSLRGPPVRLFHLLLPHLLSRMTENVSARQQNPEYTCTRCQRTVPATIIPHSFTHTHSWACDVAYHKWYLHPPAAIQIHCHPD